MIAFLVIVPMVFLAMVMNVFMAMLVAVSAVVTLTMGIFVGALITYGTAFVSFLIIIFS
jgi:hypothetical protein